MNELVPGLQALFVLLRDAGIVVGVEEIRRLATIFAMEPELDAQALRRVLEAVLVKSLDERAIFDRVYGRWMTIADRHIAAREQAVEARKKAARPAAMAPGMAAASSAPRRLRDLGDGQAPRPSSAAMLAVERSRDDDDGARSAEAAPASPPAPIQVASPIHDLSEPHPPLDQAAVQGAQHTVRREPPLVPTSATGKESWHRMALVVAALATAILVGVGIWRLLPATPGDNGDNGESAGIHDAGAVDAGQAIVPPIPRDGDRLVTYQPRLETSARQPPPTDFMAYGLIALSLMLGAWLWRSRGRGHRVPVPRPPRARSPMAHAAPRGPPVHADSLILDERDEDDLVWGVGRFVSDEDGRDLDVDRTVDDTASAYGRPVLRYQAARYQREAWLWVDESLDTPVARHLASDLATMLERSGLPVVRASFWGIPDTLHVDQGDEDITVDAFDARRDSAAVAILTDGRLLGAAHRARNRRDEVHQLLRNLSFWPRVTFIDFGDAGRGELRAIAGQHGLSVIAPDHAPAAISELAHSDPWRDPGQLFGDARVWAAACALTPLPVSNRTALSLRRGLGLKISPWALETMRDHAERDAGGLTWPVTHRAELLSWLVRAQELPGKVLHAGLLARVIDAWRTLIDQRERAQRKLASQHGRAWEGSAEAVELTLERALITLWTQPDQAAGALYRLARAGHGERIRHYLRDLAPRECQRTPGDTVDGAAEDIIILPWRLRDLRRASQVWLCEMGFAARARTWPGHRSMPRPARLWLAVGLCAGLAAGTAGALIEKNHVARQRPPELAGPAEGQWPGKSYVHMDEEPGPDGRWSVQAGSLWRDQPEELEAWPNQRITVRWREVTVPCSKDRDGVEIRRCTSDDEPPDTSSERWSFAVIARQDAELARAVALELLDSGSVDGAFLVTAPVDYDALDLAALARPGDLGKRDQLLLVVPEPWPESWPELRPESWPELGGYPGRVVVLSVDDLGRLRGVLDFERGQEKSLAEALEAAGELAHLRDAPGDPRDFVVKGLGQCGARGEPCCGMRGGAAGVCDDPLECKQGVCEEPPPRVCEPGARECKDDTLMICSDDGTAWDAQDCGPERVCSEDQCVARTCAPGAVVCSTDGRGQRVCNQRGTGFFKRACPRGALCRGGGCRPIQGAIIEFRPVQVRFPRRARQVQTYVECRAGGSRPVRLRMASAPASGPAKRVRIALDAPARPRSITVECSLMGFMGKGVELVHKSEKTHAWDLSSERRTHGQAMQMKVDSGRAEHTISIDVRYTITLELAGGAYPPEHDSVDPDGAE